MSKKIISILIISSLTVLSLVGCGSNTGKQNLEATEVESTLNTFDVDYSKNEDGTYTCGGNSFKYKIEVYGIEQNKESTFVILTNNKDISFETVSKSLSSSAVNSGEPEFVILGWY